MKQNNVISGMYFGTADQEVVPALRTVYWMLGFWFLAAFIGGVMNVFNLTGQAPAPLGAFLAIPIGGFILAYAASPQLRHALAQIPLWLLTIAHLWRLVGLGFVAGTMLHVLPPEFGYPEGLGDVIAALLCIPLAIALRSNQRAPGLRTTFVLWNVYGLIDLLSAISVGVLYSNGSLGILRTDLSTALMVTFPVNLIPTFFVPLFILVHLLSLARIRELA